MSTVLGARADLPLVNAPCTPEPLERRLASLRRHRTCAEAADAAVIAGVAMAAAFAPALSPAPGEGAPASVIGCAVVAAVWIAALVPLQRASRRRSLGQHLGLLPVLRSAAIALTALAVLAGLTGGPALSPHVLFTIPVGVGALTVLRLASLAHGLRAPGESRAHRTLVVGDRAGIEHVVRSLRSGGNHHIVGVAISDPGTAELSVDGQVYTVHGSPADAARICRDLGADTVIVAGGTDDPDFVRRLSWSLEGAATDLVLATRLTDVAVSRISFERAEGLALTHVSLPRFDHSSMRAKRALDVVVALVALIPVAMVTPLIAALIALDTPGGVFFRQRRIGRDGREFDIIKFRTMSATAESELDALSAANEGAGPLFKLRQDPRVTRVGAVLRRFSLDELPQFWNVLMGEMSVVGPRPPLPREVRDYDGTVFRRLYVPPGITGLWQVSGRSDLSWEQSVRLDLHYVENWSLATDLRIMGRTAAVLVRPRGAY
ncbi:sugar transferase [Microbacterium sp. zg-Y818]|uniref:sugar transferase n=1 Tax=unclassified Microbacterium TaxID=2609290 RepID=UPI00214B259F|nr:MULTISPECIES: sugar transferase [unclassified Microbacterium]MCR2801894.1 sugar transferase [Microbacterium sp. zg.Y818]WIM22849.1 sugar transferase [Microbacterium sp. zg-Y818]